jgi:5-methylcytosine-specific restriction protein A
MREGNLAVLQHAMDGRSLRLFVADGSEPNSDTRIQRYVGEFVVDEDRPYVTAEAPDSGGNTRSVFVYRLLAVGPVIRREEDASDAGDVKQEALTELVSVKAVVNAEGSAEPVPVEALGTGR